MLEARRRTGDELELWGAATLADAHVLHAALLDTMDVPGTVTLDLFGLEDLDFAGMQILAAFVRSRGRERVAFTGCPEALQQRIRLAGLESWIPA